MVKEFEIHSEVEDGMSVIVLLGDLDVATQGHLSDALDRILLENRVVVDLTGCEFIDSSGLQVLDEARRARGDDSLRVVAVGRILRIFELMELDSLFALYPSREAALRDG